MKKYGFTIIMALLLISTAILSTGCGDKKGEAEKPQGGAIEEVTNSADNESFEAVTDSSDNESLEAMTNSSDNESLEKPEDKVSNGEKASSGSEPTSLYFLTKDMLIEDKMDKYAVNMMEQGYTGDIGDIIPKYKDVDLDGDGIPDIIKRYGDYSSGNGYRIAFSGGGNIETELYSVLPNEGEVIEFCDMDKDNTDEILITHCTLSTAGPSCWQTFFYAKNNKGIWQGFPIIDGDNKLYLAELENMIKERNGVSYYDHRIRFADIELTDDGIAILADFGEKDGAEQTIDYEGVLLVPDFDKIKKGIASDKDALVFKGSSKENAGKYWPSDAGNTTDAEDAGEAPNENPENNNSDEETIPEYFLYVKAPDGYANLRKGPGTEYDIICQIPNGEELEVYRGDATAKNGKKWLKVAYFVGSDDDYQWITGWIAESQLE